MSSRPGEARPAKGSGSRSRPLQVPNRGASAGVSGLPAAPVALGVPPQEDAKNLGQRGRSYGMKQGLAGGGERLARSPVSSASRERGGRWEPGPRMRRSLPGGPCEVSSRASGGGGGGGSMRGGVSRERAASRLAAEGL